MSSISPFSSFLAWLSISHSLCLPSLLPCLVFNFEGLLHSEFPEIGPQSCHHPIINFIQGQNPTSLNYKLKLLADSNIFFSHLHTEAKCYLLLQIRWKRRTRNLVQCAEWYPRFCWQYPSLQAILCSPFVSPFMVHKKGKDKNKVLLNCWFCVLFIQLLGCDSIS